MGLGDIPSCFCFYSGEVLRRLLQHCGTCNKLRVQWVLQKQQKGSEALSQFHLNLFCTHKIFHLETILGRKENQPQAWLQVGFGGQNTHPCNHVQTEL